MKAKISTTLGINRHIVLLVFLLDKHNKVEGVKQAIGRVGAYIFYLPLYSPNFNPIAQIWSRIKAFLRKVKARSVDALMESLPTASSTITVQDIFGCFQQDGYSRS